MLVFCGIFIDREKITAQKSLIFVAAISSAAITIASNTIILFSVATTLINLVASWAVQCAVYRRPLKSLAFVAFFFTILASIDSMFIYSIAYITKMPVADIILEHSSSRLLTLIFTKSLLVLIVYTVFKLTAKNSVFPKRFMLSLFGFSVLALSLTVYLLSKDIHSSTSNLTVFTSLFFIAVLILILVLFFGVMRLGEYYQNKQQNDLLALRNQMLEKSMSETEKTFFCGKQAYMTTSIISSICRY